MDNVLRLISLLREVGSLRVSDASRELGVGQSTAHRLLSMLVFREFATQDDERRYLPGVNLGTPAQLSDYTKNLETVAAPVMLRLRRDTQETINLVVQWGRDVRFISSVESPQLVRVGDRRGVNLPMQKSSGGKAILAAMSTPEVRTLFEVGTQKPSLSDAEWVALVADLRLVRRRGYALNEGQTETEVCALGVALCDSYGKPFAGLSLATPRSRWSRKRASAWFVRMVEARDEIQSRISSYVAQ